MNTWVRSGPVVVEVDGAADGLRVLDYACLEALRSKSALVLVGPYQAYTSVTPVVTGEQSELSAEGADGGLRTAVSHVRRCYGDDLQVTAVAKEGPRLTVLPRIARNGRMLVVGRSRTRGPRRLVSAEANLLLAGRAGCPVVVVPPSWRPSDADRLIAVGVDGRPLSAEALEFAVRVAAERHGDLIVVHAGIAPDRAWNDADPADAGIRHGDQTIDESLNGWTSEFPWVKVTRFLTSRAPVDALVHESQEVGLVVLGCHRGSLPLADPVARRSIAAMSCPVAVVPHDLTAAERERLRKARADRRTGVVAPTY